MHRPEEYAAEYKENKSYINGFEILEQYTKNTSKTSRHLYWKCKCKCGNICDIRATLIRTGKQQGCQKCYSKKPTTKLKKEKQIIDLTKTKIGRWLIIKFSGYKYYNKRKVRQWLCRCECGVERNINQQTLLNGNSKSCGCYKKERTSKVKLENLSTKKFGSYTVLERYGKSGSRTKWKCRCSCGNINIVFAENLKSGNSTSCGNCSKNVKKKISNKTLYLNRPEMGTQKYKDCRRKVYKRDNWKCVCCGFSKNGLNMHHLDGWNWAINKRFTLTNLVTLCYLCHNKFHKIYGRGDNNKEQFAKFLYEFYNKDLDTILKTKLSIDKYDIEVIINRRLNDL